MQDRAAPSQDRAPAFTLREAADVLGVSLNTLRRRIAAGQVRADRIQRPQGHVWQVYLDGAAPCRDGSGGTVQRDGAGTVQQPPADLMRAEAMATYTRSLLEPLVARLAEQEQIIREQAEQIGSLRAQLAAAEDRLTRPAVQNAQQGPSAPNLGAQPGEPTPPEPSDPPAEPPPPLALDPLPPKPTWWRRWWPAIAAVVVALVANGSSCQGFGRG